ncbi:MAG: ABC transporter substrate-binding protein [Telmatospirillum sp.]|nr:ABC transporter substrate-binding protein [Telmatospirillum sp.]
MICRGRGAMGARGDQGNRDSIRSGRRTFAPAVLRLAVALAFLTGATGSAAAGMRVASTAVCADQFPLALADPGDIVGISVLGHDPAVSALAGRATTIPTLKADAETYLTAGADMVIGAEHGDTKTIVMLQRVGVQVLRVPSRNDFPEMMDQLATVGGRMGLPQAGRALADGTDRRLSAVRARTAGPPVVAAYYRPDGGSAGHGTFVDAEMRAGGYESLASHLGQSGWGRLDLETLVMHPPQAMVIAFFDRASVGISRRFTEHPAFRKMLSDVPVIAIPGAATACGNWTLVDGVEFLAATRGASALAASRPSPAPAGGGAP